ncbi:hypothetical protein NSK_005572 [Nannochloropsis salina CCMP1776]|uniref:Uncharacterized protein n=1 Tax=Nannochloropsis salina CCMP1776 TaxID=1027361 RepID=A0A4D9CZN8_9STRA|nr:hypothetical protein NSK_005572 [Nannochloropsis salina CCMP1776]|eukprot:TFJ83103.1 hypothetical protein NSK_005572 [Nannochloropsis salina CCMP1776]
MEGGGKAGREERGGVSKEEGWTLTHLVSVTLAPRSCPSSPAPSLPPSSLLWVGGTLFYTTLTSVRCCLLAATIFAGKEEGGKEEEKKGGRGGGREGGGEEVAVLDMEVGSVKAASPRADDAIAHGVSLQGRQDEEGGGRKGSGRCEWLPWLSTIPSLASTWFKQHSSSLPPSPQRASHLLLPHANASPAGAMAAAGTPPGAEGGKEGGREGGREVEAGEEKKGRKGSEGGRGPLLEAA